MARDEFDASAPLTFSRVRQTSARRSSSLVTLGFDSTSGTRGSITTTEEHPFWVSASYGRMIELVDTEASGATHTKTYATCNGRRVESDHGWTFAADLRSGDTLATPKRTQDITVAGCKALSGDTAMVYNLDVGGTHTYFVSPPDAPDQCIWVHNAERCKRVSSKTLRNKWEKEHGEPWPKDPKDPTRNQDVAHKKALADGGTNDVDNYEPKPHDEHMREHKENGDCSRWGKRAHGGKE
jgi:hypothetical protein